LFASLPTHQQIRQLSRTYRWFPPYPARHLRCVIINKPLVPRATDTRAHVYSVPLPTCGEIQNPHTQDKKERREKHRLQNSLSFSFQLFLSACGGAARTSIGSSPQLGVYISRPCGPLRKKSNPPPAALDWDWDRVHPSSSPPSVPGHCAPPPRGIEERGEMGPVGRRRGGPGRAVFAAATVVALMQVVSRALSGATVLVCFPRVVSSLLPPPPPRGQPF
jgi:hypothetical protein